MANEEQLTILKQGVTVWNEWRENHADIRPDLSNADLSNADLSNANLSSANLTGADLTGADLSRADLGVATLSFATLSGATLVGADLSRATLIRAYLRSATLSFATLSGATLSEADLSGADFSNARMNSTTIGNVDLSTVKGLETVKHYGPSTIGIDTIYQSKGNIPHKFLLDAGVPKDAIDYLLPLAGKAIDFYSCFISYSSKNHDFAQRLYNDLQGQGVRCWFAPEDLKIGDEIRQGIDQAIHVHDKLLLVLSEQSVSSRWVQKEVETAFEREAQHGKLVLFPIRLDSAVMDTSQAWAADIRRMRNIGDFSQWKEHDAYQKAFDRLLRDLKAEAP